MAFMVAKNTNESLNDIMWSMPAMQVFKMISIIYTANTGKKVATHEDKAVIRKQQAKAMELVNAR